MAIIKTVPSYSPKCPNHNETLDGVPFPMPQKGEGRCPVSGAHFSFEATIDQQKMVKGKDGQMQPEVGWKIEGRGVEE